MRVACLAALLLLVGCDKSGENVTGLTASDLFPSHWKNSSVTLRIADLEIPAEVTVTEGGTRRKLTMTRDGSAVEEEVYDVTTEEIALVQLGTKESFSPPIPLLTFPLQLGQQREWRGQMLLADKEVSATAKIGAERTLADLPGGSVETVLVAVSLTLTGDQGAERTLRIWFVNGDGPIKRDFGNQIREPRASQ